MLTLGPKTASSFRSSGLHQVRKQELSTKNTKPSPPKPEKLIKASTPSPASPEASPSLETSPVIDNHVQSDAPSPKRASDLGVNSTLEPTLDPRIDSIVDTVIDSAIDPTSDSFYSSTFGYDIPPQKAVTDDQFPKDAFSKSTWSLIGDRMMAPDLQSLCLTNRWNASYFQDRLTRVGIIHTWGNRIKGDPGWGGEYCGAEEEVEKVEDGEEGGEGEAIDDGRERSRSGDLVFGDCHKLNKKLANRAPSGGVPIVDSHRRYPVLGQDPESDDEEYSQNLARVGIVNNSGPLGRLGKGNPALWAIQNLRINTLGSMLQSGLQADLRFQHPLPCPNANHKTDEERINCKAKPYSLLTYAICCGHAQMVEVILSCYETYPGITHQVNHCPINSKDDIGMLSALHYALSHEPPDDDILHLLFSYINPDVNFGDRETPLMWICKEKPLKETETNFMNSVRKLLDLDAAINKQGLGYETVLHRAVANKMTKFTHLFLTTQEQRYKKAMQIQKENEIAEWAAKNPQSGDYIPTPGELEQQKIVLPPHWHIPPATLVNMQDDAACTPLHYAVMYLTPKGLLDEESYDPENVEGVLDRKVLVDTLLGFGADPNKRNKFGETPLHYAVCSCEGKGEEYCVVKRLRRAGAKIDVRDFEGLTPVDSAERKRENGIGSGVCWMEGLEDEETLEDEEMLQGEAPMGNVGKTLGPSSEMDAAMAPMRNAMLNQMSIIDDLIKKFMGVVEKL
ncbi:ankyrin repeat-containing domain protein [Pyronema domesticum]|uniref:Similar to Ankyrin repeat domain-containing protein 54 acc. no. Q6DGX3 n=1 Tax=Pyronema omphalodes (strain CBS 100304) TaxID=1076935 RepID=U4LPI5_PYROM|nr:ankyrin repeat-containing domain protein [Pyronema domesticum]CCX31235.1 Similar to Ankyrin repeat domain-containing protein 54; acc. no. Q6DGX3 [Pyronema omphalodes CBS 100304]